MTAGGQTYKQTFRVERVSGNDESTAGPVEEEVQDDINGGIFPKLISPLVRWWEELLARIR